MQPARSSQEVSKRGGASSVPYGLLCHAAVADIWGAGKTGGVHFAAPHGQEDLYSRMPDRDYGTACTGGQLVPSCGGPAAGCPCP